MANGRETAFERRRRTAIQSGVTSSSTDFHAMCKSKPHRVGIVAEGDSWFAYPRKWIAFGADINTVHHISDRIWGKNVVNLMRMASSGDEAVGMTAGKQKKRLYNILKKNSEHIDLLLFSGGGNDIVGKDDMIPLLNEYEPGMNAQDCINNERFGHKLEAIILAYRRLIDLCEDIVPQASIVTHTYDIPQPKDQGAEFFWGVIKSKPWIYPYLVRRGIPEALHYTLVEHMLGTFAAEMMALASEPQNHGRLVVVDTQGTLRPGHGRDWLNEIHPTAYGFKRITKKIYLAMRDLQPGLPAWG